MRYIFAVMFVLILSVLNSKADSINVSVGVGSKHFLPYELNEKNGGIGVGYEYNYNKDIAINLDYLRFVNSYSRDTTFIGLTTNYTPLYYKDYKLGIFGGIVHNDGYCKFYDYCSANEDTTDYLPIGGISVQLDNILLKGMALPNTDTNKIDAVVWNIQFKAMEF